MLFMSLSGTGSRDDGGGEANRKGKVIVVGLDMKVDVHRPLLYALREMVHQQFDRNSKEAHAR